MLRITARARALYQALLRDDSAALGQLQASVAELGERLDRLEPPAHRHDPAVAYLGDHEAVVTTTWGRRLIVRTDDYIVGPELLSTGAYEPGLTSLIPQLLSPGGTFVDVGANIGYYSLLAASVVGAEGFVVAFEPHPATARLAQVNLVLNQMWGSSVVEVRAAHHEEAELEFFASIHRCGVGEVVRVSAWTVS